jgi:hypothetical protein
MRYLTSTVVLAASLLANACSDQRDERLARFAEHSMQVQSRQNEQVARQNAQLADASRSLIEADAQARKELIEADAKARRELSAAHAKLQQDLQQERGSLDQQRVNLDQDRKQLAQERRVDPIIAEAITAVGVLLACLAPLALAGYVLFAMQHHSDETDAVNELLIREFTSDRPILLPPLAQSPALLEHGAPPSLPAPGQAQDVNTE